MTFEQKIEQCYDRLVNAANIFTRNKDKAQDLAHDTIVKAMSKKHKYEESKAETIFNWLCSVMRHVSIDKFRRKKIQSFAFDSTSTEGQYRNITGDTLTPYQVTQAKERERITKEALKYGLSQLSPSKREALKMNMIEGVRSVKIAELLDVEHSTIRSRIFNAKKDLKRIIKKSKYSVHLRSNNLI